jgi:ABC-2 type transport system ATP-binding protein
MHEAEELCNRVAIIDHGQIIALDNPFDLTSSMHENDILSIEGTIPDIAQKELTALPGVMSAEILIKKSNNGTSNEMPYLNITCENSHQLLPDIISTLTTNGAIIRNIDKKETTLEDFFVKQTGRSLMDDTSQSIKEKLES